MLNPPEYIPSEIGQQPLEFAWNYAVWARLEDWDALPQPLSEGFAAVNYKGKMALGLACLEWVLWRLAKLTDVSDALARVEAAWASQVSTAYCRNLAFTNVRDDVMTKGNPLGPLQSALAGLSLMHIVYRKGKTQMITYSGSCALLAFHVMPRDCGFEPWLQEALGALAITDPCGPDYDRRAGSFDYNAEASLPRSWFETLTVPRDLAIARLEWNKFLAQLDPSTNPYLVPADEMRANGFQGKPYTLA